MYPDELPASVAERIRSGELPSAVLRSIVNEHPSDDEHHLDVLLCHAFDNSELIHYVWSWKRHTNTPARDTQFDIWVISCLLRGGVSLSWDSDYCKSESQRIKPALEKEAELELLAAKNAVSFDTLVRKIKSLEGRLACIEALWDGDTGGWFIILTAIMSNGYGLEEKYLGTISFGGDIRLFAGGVPPWPEAIYAQDVGEKIAQLFGATFYFPSPEKPDDQLPSWIQTRPQTGDHSIKFR